MDTDQLTFIVQISDDAIDDLKIIKKSGTPAIKTKIERIIQELQTTPTKGVGAPEQLKGEEGVVYSRTLNKKDRLVYEILEEEKIIIIVSMWIHYEF